MKRKLFSLFGLLAVLLVAGGPASGGPLVGASQPGNDPDVHDCTVITVSQGDEVFFGGNDDYITRDSTYWVDAGSADHYGAIYFGARDNVQQGFNEVGLAYDANGTPPAPVTSHPGTKPVYGGYGSYLIQILEECATMGRLVADAGKLDWEGLTAAYGGMLMESLAVPGTRGKNVNVLQHLMGFLKNHLSSEDKADLR